MRVVLVVLIAGLCACRSSGPTLSERDRQCVEQEVTLTLGVMVDAERRRDAEAVLGLLGPEFFMITDGHRVDRAGTVTAIGTTMPKLQAFDADFQNIEVIALDRNTALSTMTFQDVITDESGTTSRQWGPSTMLWQRIDGQWKMRFADSDHYAVEGER